MSDPGRSWPLNQTSSRPNYCSIFGGLLATSEIDSFHRDQADTIVGTTEQRTILIQNDKMTIPQLNRIPYKHPQHTICRKDTFVLFTYIYKTLGKIIIWTPTRTSSKPYQKRRNQKQHYFKWTEHNTTQHRDKIAPKQPKNKPKLQKGRFRIPRPRPPGVR